MSATMCIKAVPCPAAHNIGKLLNLVPKSAASPPADVDGQHPSMMSGNRWLYDVLDIAEVVQAEKVDIILDEQVESARDTIVALAR